MVVLVLFALAATTRFKAMKAKDFLKILKDAGVAVNNAKNVAWEVERKRFKLVTLGVPMVHQMLINFGVSNTFFVYFCWTFTLFWIIADVMRIYKVPVLGQVWNWVFRDILRPTEHNKLSQASYILLGCSVTVHFFTPVIAMTSIIFLVMGTMASALVTRSFGKSVVNVERAFGSSSPEGSLAMFVVCFVFGCSIFHGTYLREYFVFVASLAATMFEYFEPFGISYNLGIPIVSSICLTLGYERVLSCGSSVLFDRWLSSIQYS
jgi:dolichol kinase